MLNGTIAAERPFVSVIVPTYNRADELRRCLDSLVAQDYPRDRFEVIVADDGSARSPAVVVDAYRGKLDVDMLAVAHGGPARARNRAAEQSRGAYLAFTDDDCRPHADWLSAIARALTRSPEALVGGRVQNALPDNVYSSASQTVTDVVYAHYNAEPEAARFFASNNMAVAKAKFLAIGGFDENFQILACEDRELCDRWRSAGGRMLYAPEAVVGHAHALDLRHFLRQHFTYGRGAVHYHRIRAERQSGKMRDEMSFHADVRNWLVAPFRGRAFKSGLVVASLLLCWQAANTAGFLYETLAQTGYRR
jgi:GT2 family glycosyltransferase